MRYFLMVGTAMGGDIKKIFLLLCLVSMTHSAYSAYSAERIYYEDCEDTVYTEHFLEDHYGQVILANWNEFLVEVSQSATAYSGSYSLTYDPYLTGNPYGRVGRGPSVYGNLSDFDLDAYEGRYWYFRWYQRWEAGATYSGNSKQFYLNYSSFGNFYCVIQKGSGGTFQTIIIRNDTSAMIYNEYDSVSDVDDDEWHKMEVFFDVGTTGSGNGDFWFKVDDVTISAASNMTLNETIPVAPMHSFTGWPSNSSAETGSQQTWLDEFEIWVLTGPEDLPGATPTPEALSTGAMPPLSVIGIIKDWHTLCFLEGSKRIFFEPKYIVWRS